MSEITGNWESFDIEHFVDAIMRDTIRDKGGIRITNGQFMIDFAKIASMRVGVPWQLAIGAMKAAIDRSYAEYMFGGDFADFVRPNIEQLFKNYRLTLQIEEEMN